MDLPVWQALHTELGPRGFTVITVAMDSGGAKDAGSWIAEAKPTHPSLIDSRHLVAELYGWVNVPSNAWIDEEGRLVRPNDPGFAGEYFRGMMEPGFDWKAMRAEYARFRDRYLDAVRDYTETVGKGCTPPSAINWKDPDNNVNFHNKTIMMTHNATISIAAAQMDKPDLYLKEIITTGPPLGNDGKPVASVLAIAPTIIPKGSKNVDGAKALLRDFIKPENLNAYLKETRARYLPVMGSIVKNDPYWTDPKDPHRQVAVDMGLIKPTVPWWMSYNPAYSAVLSEQIWPQAEANITQRNMTAEQATDEAAKRIKQLFEQYQK